MNIPFSQESPQAWLWEFPKVKLQNPQNFIPQNLSTISICNQYFFMLKYPQNQKENLNIKDNKKTRKK
jgi:hypothetical protein